ncbi:hypothetical protein SY83_09570 [Paenibacillus swuensis]|uniref:DUF1772 domain-containing protein n=1 Tax=Paenibacillus swuensis TaxID=1178515 RepID=A0A172THW6_9BACL|nr:hypothetical protein [Paenibacillus swuensis]ANE46484.1 hypothetical protein SY83_09570 [Paenibacillus swuensis]
MEQTSRTRRVLKETLLWLFIINLGIAFGAGLYEGRVVVPGWSGTSPSLWPNTGILFWAYVTTVPLTLLTIANAVAAWTTKGPRRRWYIVAVTLIIIERAVTFSYFIPTMIGLMDSNSLSQGEIDRVLSQWEALNYGRHLLNLAGWLAALKVLTR